VVVCHQKFRGESLTGPSSSFTKVMVITPWHTGPTDHTACRVSVGAEQPMTGEHAWAGVALVVIGGFAAPLRAAAVQALRVDGTTVQGEWAGRPDSNSVSILTADHLAIIAFDDVARLSFESPAKPPEGSTVFLLADGGRLYGELVGEVPEAVVTRTVLGNSVPIAFNRLAAIQFVRGGDAFAKAEELFVAALRARLPAQDVLITRDPEDTKSLRGRLESLDAESGSFAFADRPRTFQTDKIFGIVFATGANKQAVFPVTLELSDGSVVSGAIERADTEFLKVATSIGSVVELKVAEVMSLRVRSPRVVYVSDLSPAAERTEGMLHRPWPVRRDRGVSAAPLSMAGRAFDKGLGVHAKTELDYLIGGGYESLVATIGIDDAVRPSGSVVFRVLGDGKVLFDGGVLTGQDAPRDLQVDVKGVKLLTLVVDYGEGLDLSDHADWGGVRLLKPAARSTAPSDR